MKLRIFKKEDGSVIYNYPAPKYKDRNLEECKIPDDLKGLPFIILDESEIHPSDSTTGNYHEMIHFEGECKKENLKQDKGWDIRLMPNFLIKQKHLIKLNQKIDQELSKKNPDAIKLMRHHREKESCGEFTERQWAEKALANLDERVANGEPDKPKIRIALNKKIEELKVVELKSEKS